MSCFVACALPVTRPEGSPPAPPQGADVLVAPDRAGRRPQAWAQLLRAHSKLTHELDDRLRAAHGLTLEVLLFLSWAPESGSRPVDLARGVLLTQGGITRLLDRLDRADVVERSASADDGRVAYARLTEPAASRLRDAASTHVGNIRSLLGDRFSPEELARRSPPSTASWRR